MVSEYVAVWLPEADSETSTVSVPNVSVGDRVTLSEVESDSVRVLKEKVRSRDGECVRLLDLASVTLWVRLCVGDRLVAAAYAGCGPTTRMIAAIAPSSSVRTILLLPILVLLQMEATFLLLIVLGSSHRAKHDEVVDSSPEITTEQTAVTTTVTCATTATTALAISSSRVQCLSSKVRST